MKKQKISNRKIVLKTCICALIVLKKVIKNSFHNTFIAAGIKTRLHSIHFCRKLLKHKIDLIQLSKS